MKRILAIAVSIVLLGTTASYAAQRGTAEYDQLVELKKQQRAERQKRREEEKTNPQAKPKSFWQKEAERSGFAGTGAMFSNAVFNSVPVARPNSGKES